MTLSAAARNRAYELWHQMMRGMSPYEWGKLGVDTPAANFAVNINATGGLVWKPLSGSCLLTALGTEPPPGLTSRNLRKWAVEHVLPSLVAATLAE